jgi:hypothetical protein
MSLVPDNSLLQVEIAVNKVKKYKLPGSDQILAELILAECKTLMSEIHNYVWRKKELPDQWKSLFLY